VLAYLSAMRGRTTTAVAKVEMTALFAGLLSVAMHSFVDFNLYILSILLLAGLILGRLHVLAFSGRHAVSISLEPSAWVSERGYRLLTAAVAGLPLLYFVTLGLSSFEYRRGLQLSTEAKWEEAYYAFESATRYFPYADNTRISKADLLRHLIEALPASAMQQKRAMFDEAESSLARAEALNPLRPQVFATRAFLYENNPSLAGPDWSEKTTRDYRRAIDLEPRAYQARYLYANFLLKREWRDEARRILEDGMKYVYVDSELIVPYYTLTTALRRNAGDQAGAEALNTRIQKIQASARARTPTAKKTGPN
jgi:hypothetical protein